MFLKGFLLYSLGAVLRGGMRFINQPSTDDNLLLSRIFTQATSQCVGNTAVCPNLVLPESLIARICWSVQQSSPGVKVLWAPKGFGKTVAVRIAVGRLLKSNQISGRILIAASELNLTCGTPLLRQLSGKWGAEWGRQLSELFGKATKPVLLLIDQIDNFMMSPEGVKRTQNLIKTLAEDSDLNRNYVVLAVCSCPELATALLDANGRQKITSVSSSISQYKWGAKQIGDLLRKVGGDEAVAGEPWRDALHSSATLAGTPGFLVHHFNHLTDAGSHQILRLRIKSMRAEAKEMAALWNRGERELEESPCYE